MRRRWSPVGALALVGLVALAPACTEDPAAPDVLVRQDGTIMQPSGPAGAPTGGWAGWRGTAPEPPATESVIGLDDRRPAAVARYPGRAVGALTRNGASWCTAFLVAADTVLTAGHCVHDGGTGASWVDGLRFAPGRAGASEPYGSCAPRPNGLAALQGFTRDADEAHDLAVIRLDCRIGEQVGWIGVTWSTASPATGTTVMLQGYAADRGSHTQWVAGGTVVAATATQLFHDADTGVGMSGSALWQDTPAGSPCTASCAVAIHAYGLHDNGPHALANHGTRLTERLANVIAVFAGGAPAAPEDPR